MQNNTGTLKSTKFGLLQRFDLTISVSQRVNVQVEKSDRKALCDWQQIQLTNYEMVITEVPHIQTVNI